MKKALVIALFSILNLCGLAQSDTFSIYRKTSVMIPMRDGTKLFTVIIAPQYTDHTFPILIQRTPYGADMNIADGSDFDISNSQYAILGKGGYIFIRQDIRGKYKSEGQMEIHQPVIHLKQKTAVDESTDTYDTVDWLIKHVAHNNGKAGIYGISYPGWLALLATVDPHPALKASSEQACMSDLFLGDDFHHNGAFRLSYGMEYSYEIEHDKTTDSDFPFQQYDLFDWYKKLGSLKNVNAAYFHQQIPTWNKFVTHPNYDTFWQRNSTLDYVTNPSIPILHVGGYFDQEDLNGPQLMYAALEKKDTFNRNYIVLGPWFHGQWARGTGESIGRIKFGTKTSYYFQQLEKQWFDYWLKGIGDGKFNEATSFQTGSNTWKTYTSWPPKESEIKKLYASAKHTASFKPPVSNTGSETYISDPANPVPYRSLPIEATYGKGSRWRTWQVEDQRFVYSRPDVISFMADSLTEDLVVTGKITAHINLSTSGTDADLVVKLIDVYPAIDTSDLSMSNFQLPVAMEVFRGRFRKSFEKPIPFIPNKPEEIIVDLHQINHDFRKGHHLMIQIQSSWFPVIDRNPQQFVPNIFEAKDSDFIKAKETIYFSSVYPSYIELPVMKN